MALPARPTPPLLLAALLAAVAACKGPHATPPRPTLLEREAACAPVWQKVHAEIDASSACSADWECRAIKPEYLGCDAWANLDYRLSEGRLVELENACAAISFAPKCGEQVGACKAGRCAWKRPVRNEQACAGALDRLASRLAVPARCNESRECAIFTHPEGLLPAPAEWSRKFPEEWAVIREACSQWPPPTVKITGSGSFRPACVEGTCAVQPDAPAAPPELGHYTKPVELEKGCIGRATRVPPELTGIAGRVTIKFAVSPRGIPHHFELVDEPSAAARYTEYVENVRRKLLIALAESISQCAFEPGRIQGAPAEIWLVVPIKLVPFGG